MTVYASSCCVIHQEEYFTYSIPTKNAQPESKLVEASHKSKLRDILQNTLLSPKCLYHKRPRMNFWIKGDQKVMTIKCNVGNQIASNTKRYAGHYWHNWRNMNMNCLVTIFY